MKINIKNKNSDVGFEPQTLDFKVHLQPKNKPYGPLIFAKTLVCNFFLPNYLKITCLTKNENISVPRK